jgi:hypothetical protein
MPSSPKAHARGELGQGRQCSREQLPSHHLKGAQLRPSYSNTQRPQRPPVAILRTPLVQPAAIETHVVVEASGQRVEGVMQKGSTGTCQVPPQLRIVPQLSDQDGKNKGPRIVIRAVTFTEIGHTENCMLKNAG